MKLRYGQTFLLGFGFFGVSVIWGIYNAFVPVILEKKFHLSPLAIGFFLTLDNVASLLVQPPVGAWSDRLRTRIGRRMPFLLVGAPLSAIAFLLLPQAPILPLFVLCSSTLLMSMALWRTPVVALMPDITPPPFRSQANGIINFMGGVGGIFCYFAGAALYKINPNYPYWMGAVLVLVAVFLVVAFVREPKLDEDSETSSTRSEEQPNLWTSLSKVATQRDKSTFLTLLALFFWMVSYAAIEGFWTLYSINHLKISEADGTRLLGQLSLVFVLCALPSGYLGAKIGRKITICIGLVLMMTILFIMYRTPVATLLRPVMSLPILGVVPIAGVLLMTTGVAWALINIHALPMIVDASDDEHIGTFTGLYYLFSTSAAIAGPNFNGWIVQLSHKNYNAVMLFSPVCIVVALALMFCVRAPKAEHGK